MSNPAVDYHVMEMHELLQRIAELEFDLEEAGEETIAQHIRRVSEAYAASRDAD